jgi:hypothetical protein
VKLKTKFILILRLTNNSNSNNFKENYWEKLLSFANYVYLKIGLSRKNAVLHIFTRKKVLNVQELQVNGVHQKLKNCLQTGRWVTELYVVNFFVNACISIAQQRFWKTHQMKKFQTYHYNLKYYKISMQFCQLQSIVILFCQKLIDYFWLGLQSFVGKKSFILNVATLIKNNRLMFNKTK